MNPSILHFHITSLCPYSCRHCCSDSGLQSRYEELDLKTIRKMLDEAVLLGMQEIDLSGGEPLVVGRDTILEIIRHSSREGLLTTLNTNTWFLDEGYIAELKDAGLDRVKSSLYGTSSGTHDEFTRKEGAFEQVRTALECLRKQEIEAWINYVVTPRNMGETSVLWSLLQPYGLDTIQVSSIVRSGRGKTAQDYVFEESELAKVLGTLERMFPETKTPNISYTITLWRDPESYPFLDRYCDYLKERLVVDPSGHLIPCCILPSGLRSQAGSIVNEGLECILSSQRLVDDPVFYWLGRGHRAMRERLGFEEVSNNLCSTCTKMLTALRNGKNTCIQEGRSDSGAAI